MTTTNEKNITVTGYDELLLKTENTDQNNIVIFFTGSVNEVSGKSWCPDCVVAEPIVDKVMKNESDSDTLYIKCIVGDRTFWKGDNVFRTELRLKSIPTLMNWRNKNNLYGDDINKEDLIKMLLE